MSGRKKKTIPPAKERKVTIRLTEDQYAVISHSARMSQMSVSEYIRRILMNQKVPEYNIIIHDEHKILEELRKINKLGNNLNQIARYFNENGLMNNTLYKDLKSLIYDLHGATLRFDEAVVREYEPIKRDSRRISI